MSSARPTSSRSRSTRKAASSWPAATPRRCSARGKEARLVVTFPYQHLAEEAAYEGRAKPSDGPVLTGGDGGAPTPIGIRTFPERGRPAADAFAQAVGVNRQVVAKLQRRDPAIPTDLGWKTVAATQLVVRGRGRNEYEAAWVGELDAGTVIPLQRPGANANWRVAVEEWELLPGDPPSSVEAPAATFVRPI